MNQQHETSPLQSTSIFRELFEKVSIFQELLEIKATLLGHPKVYAKVTKAVSTITMAVDDLIDVFSIENVAGSYELRVPLECPTARKAHHELGQGSAISHYPYHPACLKSDCASIEQTEDFEDWLIAGRKGTLEFDRKGHILAANDIFANFLGYSPGEMTGQTVFKFLSDHGKNSLKEKIEERKLGLCSSFDCRFVCKDQTEIWLNLSGVPCFDGQGKFSYRVSKLGQLADAHLREIHICELKERYEAILDHLPVMLAFFNENGQLEWLNAGWTRELGWPRNQTVESEITSFFSKRNAENSIPPSPMRGLQPLYWQEGLLTAEGGDLIPVETAKLHLHTGKTIGIVKNISDRKRFETLATQFLDTLSAAALVTMTDQEGRITEVNEKFCQTSGYHREELVGKPYWVFSMEEETLSTFELIWEELKSKGKWVGKIQNRKKNGEECWLQSYLTMISYGINSEKACLGVLFDVTNDVKMQHRLEEAQRVAKMGSWNCVFSNNEVTWSKELYKIFEFDPSLKDKPLFEAYRSRIQDDYKMVFEAKLDEATGLGKRYEVDLPIILDGESGRKKWVRIIGEPIRGAGDVILGLRGTCQDITNLVHAEECLKLERAKALKNAKLASLGEMSAGIAHEINNPLAIISGTLELLPQTIGNPEKLKGRIETLEKSVERISRIVKGLQKFSRSGGQRDVKPHRFVKIVREAMILTESKANRSRTQVDFIEDYDPVILCDEIEIEQVLVNLINNAIDAVEELDHRWVKMRSFERDGKAVFHIQDSGTGISSNEREKLFQPFFTTKPVGKGTGLGLAIVKGIVDEHGASISLVETNPHTCFEVCFEPFHERHVLS